MKKTKHLIIGFLALYMMILSITGISANTKQNSEENAIELFNDMQKKVDNFASAVQGYASILAGCVSLIPGYQAAGVTSLGWGITSKWNRSFAAALAKANKLGGLVSDVNTILPYYTIRTQVSFYE